MRSRQNILKNHHDVNILPRMAPGGGLHAAGKRGHQSRPEKLLRYHACKQARKRSYDDIQGDNADKTDKTTEIITRMIAKETVKV